jgi:hypothetical protein
MLYDKLISIHCNIGITEDLAMTVRVNLGEVANPYMTGRMYVKFLKSNRAILIPKDFRGETVLILDSPDSINLSERVRKIKVDLKCEILGQSFNDVLKQTERAIKDKKAFIIES